MKTMKMLLAVCLFGSTLCSAKGISDLLLSPIEKIKDINEKHPYAKWITGAAASVTTIGAALYYNKDKIIEFLEAEDEAEEQTKTLRTIESNSRINKNSANSRSNYIKNINTRYSWAKYAGLGTGVIAIAGLSAWLLSSSTEEHEETLHKC